MAENDQKPQGAPEPPANGEKPPAKPKASKAKAAKAEAPAQAPAEQPAQAAPAQAPAEQPAQAAPAQAPAAEAPAEAPKAEAKPKAKRNTVAKEDRKFVTTSGEAVENAEMGHAAGTQANIDLNATHDERKKQAQPFRIAAIVLWVLGLIAEILCFVFLKGNKPMPWVITPLVVDFVLVVVGSQLWKKANHIDPPAKGEGPMYWLKTELGVIVAVIAFFPIIIVLLLDKNSDKRTKNLATIVAVVALIAAGASGIDYHPATQEGLDAAATQASKLSDGGKCYWTEGGSVYHFNPDCSHISHSAEIVQGTVQEAFDAGKTRGCKDCTEEGGDSLLASAASSTTAATTDSTSTTTDTQATTNGSSTSTDTQSGSSTNGSTTSTDTQSGSSSSNSGSSTSGSSSNSSNSSSSNSSTSGSSTLQKAA